MTTVKAITRVTGPFPKIKVGSLICPAAQDKNPMVLMVLEIKSPTSAKCMVMSAGPATYQYGYVSCWDHSEFVLWQGELTITQ